MYWPRSGRWRRVRGMGSRAGSRSAEASTGVWRTACTHYYLAGGENAGFAGDGSWTGRRYRARTLVVPRLVLPDLTEIAVFARCRSKALYGQRNLSKDTDVTDRIRLLRAVARTAVFLALAVMLLVRLGPLCETMAMAAPSAATAMPDCASKPSDSPVKQLPSPACGMPCVAVAGDSIAPVQRPEFTASSPRPGAQTCLFGLTNPPATPPPQTV